MRNLSWLTPATCRLLSSLSQHQPPILSTTVYRDQEDRRSGYFCRPPSAPPPSSPLPLLLHPYIQKSGHVCLIKKHGKVSGVYKRGGKRREGRGRRPQGRYRDGGEGVRISGRRGEWGSRRLMSTFQGSPPPIHPVLLLLAALHKL